MDRWMDEGQTEGRINESVVKLHEAAPECLCKVPTHCGSPGQTRMRTAAPVCRAFDEPTAGFHLHVQASLHAAHLHVLMQVPVHVALGCGQLQLEGGNVE